MDIPIKTKFWNSQFDGLVVVIVFFNFFCLPGLPLLCRMKFACQLFVYYEKLHAWGMIGAFLIFSFYPLTLTSFFSCIAPSTVLISEVGIPPAFSQIGTIHFASERCRLMLRLTGFGKPSAIWNGKVFAWLLLADRMNMNMLRLRHYRVANDYTCLLCDNPPEETLAIL